MGKFIRGMVVKFNFPQTDLQPGKDNRPALVLTALEEGAVVLGEVTHGDFILCAITSQEHVGGIRLDATDFTSGSLNKSCYILPAKMFTISDEPLKPVGRLNSKKLHEVLEAVHKLFPLI